MKTFTCNFGEGVTCTVQVADTKPEQGSHVRDHEWTGTPTKKHLRPYIAWMNSVNTLLANEWNAKIAHVYQVGDTTWETWIFEPDKPCKRVEVKTL